MKAVKGKINEMLFDYLDKLFPKSYIFTLVFGYIETANSKKRDEFENVSNLCFLPGLYKTALRVQ